VLLNKQTHLFYHLITPSTLTGVTSTYMYTVCRNTHVSKERRKGLMSADRAKECGITPTDISLPTDSTACYEMDTMGRSVAGTEQLRVNPICNKYRHSTVSKMSFRLCHYHEVTYHITSLLQNYYILFLKYDGNQNHHTGNLGA
jgi:hypothetical protein